MTRLFKKKNEFSKTIVIIDITIFLLYITANIVMQWIKGYSMPVDINTGVFAFLTGELGLLSFIKRSKIKSETIQDNIQNVITSKEQLLLLQQQQSNKQGAG